MHDATKTPRFSETRARRSGAERWRLRGTASAQPERAACGQTFLRNRFPEQNPSWPSPRRRDDAGSPQPVPWLCGEPFPRNVRPGPRVRERPLRRPKRHANRPLADSRRGPLVKPREAPGVAGSGRRRPTQRNRRSRNTYQQGVFLPLLPATLWSPIHDPAKHLSFCDTANCMRRVRAFLRAAVPVSRP